MWVLGLLLLLAFIVFAGLEPYSEYLWFKLDAGYPQVFTTAYAIKTALFLPVFVVTVFALWWSLARAVQVSSVFVKRPETPGEVLVSNLLNNIQEHGPFYVKLISLFVGLGFAANFSGEWNSYLLATHGGTFGRVDPTFGRDIGFFVFTLPWLTAIANVLFGFLLLMSVLTAAAYAGLQALAAVAKIELSRPTIRIHISLLLGLTAIAFGLKLYLQRFEFGLLDNAQFTGGGYAASIGLSMQSVLCWLAMIVGVLIVVGGWIGRPFRVAALSAGGYAVLHVLGLVVIPGLTQAFVVEPDKIGKESKYASNAIEMTRFAYDLQRIQTKETTVRDEPTAAEISASQTTLDNMRLWDPVVLQRSLQGLQGLKPYYSFKDVDLDRYTIGGKQQMVMISPRDVSTAGLGDNFKTWVNTRLLYTHGFGVTMSPVNSASANGQPEFLIKDIPPVTTPEIPLTQPRVYFSDFRTGGDEYVFVDSRVDEFDYPSERDDVNYRWTGGRGIPVGGFLNKLLYSIVLGDGNLLVSKNITADTRLLYHRGVMDRATQVFPFLQFDSDPYIAVLNGRLIWILDGFTTSDHVPYSARLADRTNYIRNPIKVTVDAYSGDVNGYAIADEPILQAYSRIYPGLIKPASAMPKGLDAHLRYAEDYFRAQAIQLTQYHVTNPTIFLNNGDAWDMPTERGLGGAEEAMRPYYVQMRLPDDPNPAFLLILPFTPRQRGNMSGWLAAHCDPDNYGRMFLYQYPKGSTLPGPKQEEAYFTQNDAIANMNKLLNSEQSELIVGNLLVIPVGNSVMYVEPMFLQSKGLQPIPELKKVILALNKRIVVADTYKDALSKLFGSTASPTEGTTTSETRQPTTSSAPAVGKAIDRAAIGEVAKLLEDADKALRAGDFARYGDLSKRARERLNTLLGK